MAIHPNHACAVPVKSRNSNVMRVKNTNAKMIRILRDIAGSLVLSRKFTNFSEFQPNTFYRKYYLHYMTKVSFTKSGGF